jgi:hypothetical protein
MVSPSLKRRLNLSPLKRSSSVGSANGGSGSGGVASLVGKSPRQTRQQVAATLAVEEEVEASLLAELQRRAISGSGGGGAATPTKLLARFQQTPSPLAGAAAGFESPVFMSDDAPSRVSNSGSGRVHSAPTAAAVASPPPAGFASIASLTAVNVAPLPSSSSPSSSAAAAAASSAAAVTHGPTVSLNESARARLALSGVSHQAYLSYDWIFKRAQKYLGVLTDEEAAAQAATRKANPNHLYVKQQAAMGNLSNNAVFVAVSAQADHNPFYLDEQRKADPKLHEALRSRWVEIEGDTTSEDEEGSGRNGSSSGSGSGSGWGNGAFLPGSGKKPKERIPMLGLFASRAFAKGEWVVEYGGVLEWSGEARRRAQECNSHVRRIAASDWVWNGRPWSLLFPRIPSTLAWEAEKPLDARTHLQPLVNPRTLINLLLLLHHEQETHARQLPGTLVNGTNGSAGTCGSGGASPDGSGGLAGAFGLLNGALSHGGSLHNLAGGGGGSLDPSGFGRIKSTHKPFTEADCARRVCTGTCMMCRNELKVIRGRIQPAPAPVPAAAAAASSSGKGASSASAAAIPSGPPELSPEDVLATLLPQCCCCSVSLGLLPCEVVSLMSSWEFARHSAVLDLCGRVERDLVRAGGLGYMANTDCRARQNVRCHSVSPFNKLIGHMAPTHHIYVAMRDIAPGEELLVAYNNNEAKKMM